MKPILDDYENEIEANISQFKPADKAKQKLIEGIIDSTKGDRSIYGPTLPNLPTSPLLSRGQNDFH